MLGKPYRVITDSIVGMIDTFSALAGSIPAEDLVDVIGIADDNIVLVRGGVLMSQFRIDGVLSTVNRTEFSEIVGTLNVTLGNFLAGRKDVWIKVWFESDPDNVDYMLRRNFEGVLSTADQIGLDVTDLIQEKIEVNSRFVQSEKCYLSIYTHTPDISPLTSCNPPTKMGQASLHVADPELSGIAHEKIVSAVFEGLADRFMMKRMSAVDILGDAYRAINGDAVGRDWTPDILPLDKLDQVLKARNSHLPNGKYANFSPTVFLREVTRFNDKSLEAILPESVGRQLLPNSCIETGNDFVACGSRVFYSTTLQKYMTSETDFDYLHKSLIGLPYRIAFTLKSNGLEQSMGESLTETMIGWTPSNKYKQMALARLRSNEVHNTNISLSVTACTWATPAASLEPGSRQVKYDLAVLQERRERLNTALNTWGGCRVSKRVPDPVVLFLSTIPGLISFHAGHVVVAPLKGAIELLPISRPTSIWRQGSVLYRTDDGKPIPFEQSSSEQTADIQLICGAMGYGKSSIQITNNVGFLLKATSSNQLPIIRGIDFSYSLKGVVDIMRSALPSDQHHLARYEQLQNTKDFSFNIFLTPLGCRKPTSSHKGFLNAFLVNANGALKDWGGLSGLCSAIVDKAYEYYTDDHDNANAKRYYRGTCPEVDDALDRHGIRFEEGKVTAWYRVVDLLSAKGDYRTAALAHKQAVPIYEDLKKIANLREIVDQYPEDVNGAPPHVYFSRNVDEVMSWLPILSGVGVYDVTDCRALFFDMKDIFSGVESSPDELRKAAMIYIAVMHLLTSDFYSDTGQIRQYDARYQDYHFKRIQEIMRTSKRASFAEVHRLKGLAQAQMVIDHFVAEGRKFGVSIICDSQQVSNFSDKVQEFATTILVCNSSAASLEGLKRLYNITDEQCAKIERLGKPDREGNHFFGFFKSGSRRSALFLRNTEGPMMLCCMATETEDRYVRDFLYRIFPSQAIARKVYATEFPGGRVNKEIERRRNAMNERLYDSPTGSIITDIVHDIALKHGIRVKFNQDDL